MVGGLSTLNTLSNQTQDSVFFVALATLRTAAAMGGPASSLGYTAPRFFVSRGESALAFSTCHSLHPLPELCYLS